MEIWKSIKGYEGKYEISSLGRVKSLKRTAKHSSGNGFVKIKERVKKLTKNRQGYYITTLTKNGKNKTFTIHKLVAMTFLGHKPNGYKVIVDHINNNPLDNCVDNLQLTTQRENVSKDKVNGTSKYVGVSWNTRRKRWVSGIKIKGKSRHLGSFDNEYDAHLAYQAKLKEITQS